jgi:hypothetical protein
MEYIIFALKDPTNSLIRAITLDINKREFFFKHALDPSEIGNGQALGKYSIDKPKEIRQLANAFSKSHSGGTLLSQNNVDRLFNALTIFGGKKTAFLKILGNKKNVDEIVEVFMAHTGPFRWLPKTLTTFQEPTQTQER